MFVVFDGVDVDVECVVYCDGVLYYCLCCDLCVLCWLDVCEVVFVCDVFIVCCVVMVMGVVVGDDVGYVVMI